jgi:predicted porin
MQKKFIALAVAAAFSAPAFADTTVYGVVDAALAHVSADHQKSDLQVLSSGLAGSRLGVKSVEDLNNGMKAVVVLEYALNTQTSAGTGDGSSTTTNGGIGAARQQMLAVAGDFGTFATGYLQTTGYDFAGKFDPTSGSAVSPLGEVTKGGKFIIGSQTAAARAQRALAYISPDLGGVTVAVNYSTALAGLGNLTVPSSATVDSKSTAYLLSATYNGGPLTVGAVYTGATVGTSGVSYLSAAALTALTGETSTLSATEYALGASYDLTVVKLFATYQATKTGTNNIVTKGTDNKAYSFSLVAPVGPGAIAFSYAKNKVDATGTVATLSHVGTGTDQAANGMTLAWLQGLSKTTTFYAAYSKMSQGANTRSYSVVNDNLSAAFMTAGGSSSMIAVGLQNKF